jgi:hypothetical protein
VASCASLTCMDWTTAKMTLAEARWRGVADAQGMVSRHMSMLDMPVPKLKCTSGSAKVNPFDLDSPDLLWNYKCTSTGSAPAPVEQHVPVSSWGHVAGVDSSQAHAVKGAYGVGKSGMIPHMGSSPFGVSSIHGWVVAPHEQVITGAVSIAEQANAAARKAIAEAKSAVAPKPLAPARVGAPLGTWPPRVVPPPVAASSHQGWGKASGSSVAVSPRKVGTAPATAHAAAPGSSTSASGDDDSDDVVELPEGQKGMSSGATYNDAGVSIHPADIKAHKRADISEKPEAAADAKKAKPAQPVIDPSQVRHNAIEDDSASVNGPKTGIASDIDNELGVGSGWLG